MRCERVGHRHGKAGFSRTARGIDDITWDTEWKGWAPGAPHAVYAAASEARASIGEQTIVSIGACGLRVPVKGGQTTNGEQRMNGEVLTLPERLGPLGFPEHPLLDERERGECVERVVERHPDHDPPPGRRLGGDPEQQQPDPTATKSKSRTQTSAR